tara:strand:- start:2433 stop:2834 length:402 start_codon:yes stop_codon:yes gene_type:complete
MALQSLSDFATYTSPSVGSVSATFFEVQNSLWDQRTGNIDTWLDIDSGNSFNINLLIDRQYLEIQGNSIGVEGYQPRATISLIDAPYVSIDDLITVNEVTGNKGSVLCPAANFKVVSAEPDGHGMVEVILGLQ